VMINQMNQKRARWSRKRDFDRISHNFEWSIDRHIFNSNSRAVILVYIRMCDWYGFSETSHFLRESSWKPTQTIRNTVGRAHKSAGLFDGPLREVNANMSTGGRDAR
jgi:hypothetical protein